MLCPKMPCCPSTFFLQTLVFLFVAAHLGVFLSSAWFDQRRKNWRKKDSVNNLWVLPAQNWGIMIRILVPLFSHSVPAVKVGYATEQTETKQLFWAERMCLPQSHKGDNALLPQKWIKWRRRGIGCHVMVTTITVIGSKRTKWKGKLSAHPFIPFLSIHILGLSGRWLRKEAKKSFFTSSSSSWGIARGFQANPDM